MARNVKVHYWSLDFMSGDAKKLGEVLAKATKELKKPKFKDFKHMNVGCRMTDLASRPIIIDKKSKSALVGTIFKKRNNNLPSDMVDDGAGAEALAVKGKGIGDGAAFAYFPDDNILAMAFNHQGGRHSQFPAAMSAIGFAGAFEMQIILRKDVAQALKSAPCTRRLEAGIQFPKGAPPKDEKGGSVLETFALGGELGGVRMDIVISLSRERRGSLRTDKVQKAIKRLQQLGPHQLVKLKADVRDDEEGPTMALDLLADKLEYLIMVEEDGPRLNLKDCQAKLVSHYSLERAAIIAARDA